MLRSRRISLLAICILVISSIVSFAQEPNDGLSPGQRRLRRGYHDRIGWHLVNGQWMRASGQCEWSDLVRLRWDGTQLAIDAQPINAAAKLLKYGRNAAVEVGPAKDLYLLIAAEIPPGGFVPFVRNPIALRPGEQGVCISATELPEADTTEHPRPLRPQSLVAAPRIVRVSAIGDIDGKAVEITFISQQQGVHLKVREVDGPQDAPTNFSLQAATLDDLHRENRAQVRKYLSPLLHVLMGRDAPDLFAPGATDVYSVFAEIEPTADAARAVNALLPQMIDPNYDTRLAAVASLRKLGSAGICAIARLNRDELAPQQVLFVEQLLREHSRQFDKLDAAHVGEMRNDPVFLADCLEFTDARVRRATIAELQRILHRELKIDANDARMCARLANEIRERSNR
jgi:hypothetical protein